MSDKNTTKIKKNVFTDSKNNVYIRPKRTYQDKLSAKDIQEKLQDYIEVETDKLKNLQLNTHLRYFSIIKTKKRTKKIFRLGGFLKNKTYADKFIVLTNGKSSWSVQTKSSIFFRKLSVDEIKDGYEDELDDLEEEYIDIKKTNKELTKEVKEQIKKNNEIIKLLKQLKQKNSNLQKKMLVLENDYNNLDDDYNNLEDDYDSLEDSHKKLGKKFERLKDEYAVIYKQNKKFKKVFKTMNS